MLPSQRGLLGELTSRGRPVPPPARRASADDIRGVDEQPR